MSALEAAIPPVRPHRPYRSPSGRTAALHDPRARATRMLEDIEERLRGDLSGLGEAIALRSDGLGWLRRAVDPVLKDLRAARSELRLARTDAREMRAALGERHLGALSQAGLLRARLDEAEKAMRRAFDRIQEPGGHAEGAEACRWCASHVKPLVHQALGGTILNRLRAETAVADAWRAVA